MCFKVFVCSKWIISRNVTWSWGSFPIVGWIGLLGFFVGSHPRVGFLLILCFIRVGTWVQFDIYLPRVLDFSSKFVRIISPWIVQIILRPKIASDTVIFKNLLPLWIQISKSITTCSCLTLAKLLRAEIVIFYNDILTGKVVLWCFFWSEKSEKVHNSTFQVKISV